MTAPHPLARLQQQFDEEGAALVIRQYRAPSLRADPQVLPRSERLLGPTLLLAACAFLALAMALPA